MFRAFRRYRRRAVFARGTATSSPVQTGYGFNYGGNYGG